jgi:hypothetical protein
MRQLPFPVENAAALIRETSTLATPLLAIFMAAYGDELLGNPDQGIPPMDPIELYARIEEDFRAQLTEAGENRFNAITMALQTDAFFEDPLAFKSISKALATGDIGDFSDGLDDDATLPECMWAAFEVNNVRDDDIKFAPRILALFDKAANEDANDVEAGVSPHEEYVQSMKIELAQQLQQIGIQFPLGQLTQ